MMRISNCGRISLAAGYAALAFGSVVLQAQERPDAPTPQPDATVRQQWKPSVASEILKTKRIEIVPGFKPNLAPIEPPDNAPPLTVGRKYSYAFQHAEDFKAPLGNVLQAAFSQAADSQP